MEDVMEKILGFLLTAIAVGGLAFAAVMLGIAFTTGVHP